LYRYDARGYGLSEGDGLELSVETFVADLEAVVDAAKLERFALWGATTAGSITAIAYAASHPERVSHLVLSAPNARGRMRAQLPAEETERFLAFVKLIELGWGDDNPAFRQLLSTRMFPHATPAQITELDVLCRNSASPRHVARMMLATGEADVSAMLGHIVCPTLLFHCRRSGLMPISEARFVASGIANARFIPLETDNYIPLAGEPAFVQLIDAIEAFLPRVHDVASNDAPLGELTRREREVLDLVARGLDNADIAVRLDISEKTVRNTVSHIFDKLAVNSRARAIVLARDAGFGR
jgi:DNA-binding CsgD family transcriptional regulator/pimeloyl-ACP methyl ester carboxylesterase